MSNTTASLQHQISSARELQSVVRTMKAVAASSIGQYEASVAALVDYDRTVELALGACLRASPAALPVVATPDRPDGGTIGTIVFGSDQGLVGQFNDIVADHALRTLAALPGDPVVWAVGERVHARLADAGLRVVGLFPVPTSVAAIGPLVGKVQLQSETHRARGGYARVYVFHNRPWAGSLYNPVDRRLLPLDAQWSRNLRDRPWPTKTLPQVMGETAANLSALVREYLFISLFKACAESLVSENASRLAAMQRADKNIGDLLGTLRGAFRGLRQGDIDEDLFDVVSGFEAMTIRKR